MIIVTPPAGSVPEPRPQALITGDRAVVLVSDGGVTTTALVKAGVQIVTVSLVVYNELTSQLAQVTNDVDPATGFLKVGLVPPYLSQAAIGALNVLDGTGHINTALLPDYLSSANLTALVGANSSTVWATDPDGTPVILAGGTASGTSATYTGTVSAGTATAGTLHGDSFTANIATIGANEVNSQLYDNQSTAPGSPSANKITTYSDSNGRLNFKDPNGTVYLVGAKRIVTVWPTSGMVLGDEAINYTTGEHRIYKGATKGWRLASGHQVSSLAERNALTNLYDGYRVYCDFGFAQEHFWNNGGWHGSQAYGIQGGPVRYNQGVNDTNFRRWNETAIADPGYPYLLQGRTTLEVAQLNPTGRTELWFSICDQGTGANNQVFHQSFIDIWRNGANNMNEWNRFDAAPMTPAWMPQSGNRMVCIDWRVLANNANAYSGAYQAWSDWMLVPC